MKHQKIFRKTAWLLALCFGSALTLSACKSTGEQSTKSEHPQKEHPEHPQPTDTQK
jgi:ABC-type oligopeptide transport system substrate-binding subunit